MKIIFAIGITIVLVSMLLLFEWLSQLLEDEEQVHKNH